MPDTWWWADYDGKVLFKNGTLAMFHVTGGVPPADTTGTAAQCCCPRCKGCKFPTNTAMQMQLTLAGFGGTFSGGGGGACLTAMCADYLNQTFILDRWEYDHFGAGENGDNCQWVYFFHSEADPCVNVPDFIVVSTDIQPTGHYWIRVRVQTEFPQTGQANWTLDLGTTPPNCAAFVNLSIPAAIESYTCTHDGSPALLTSL